MPVPSTPDTLLVLAAQLDPVPQDVGANLRRVLDTLAAHPDADLAVFPELFLTGYTLPGIDRLALAPDDARLDPVRDAAARHGTAVVLGLAELVPGGPPANSALCVDERGDVAGVYRKVHLFGDEGAYFTAGREYPLVTLLGRRVGVQICYDLEFPEPARAVALAGAELLVTISANMEPFGPEHEVFARARAMENRLPHVYLNRPGTESGWQFLGGSQLIDAAGRVLAAVGDGPAVRPVRLPLGVGPDRHDLPDYLADRRPDVQATPVRAVR